MIVILLYGFSQAGKDTCADIFVKEHGFERYAFADKVKEYAAERCQVPVAYFHDNEKKKMVVDGKTLRQHCIEIGETGRAKDPEFWGKLVVEAIQQKGSQRIVFSDWRCYPEFFAVQKAFPTATILPVHIRRTGQYISPVPDMTEYNLAGFPFPFVLYNNGVSLDPLREQIKNLPL